MATAPGPREGVNVYWPDGNFATKDAWKACGKGIEKTVGIDLNGAWTYPGTTVRIQHCQEAGGPQDRGSVGKNWS